MSFLRAFFLFTFFFFSLCTASDLPKISLEAAKTLHENGQVILIDVRETYEHETGIAKGARRMPLSTLGEHLNEVPQDKPVLFICRTQNRSPRAVALLMKNGWTNVRYVEGGMSVWTQKGYPKVAP